MYLEVAHRRNEEVVHRVLSPAGQHQNTGQVVTLVIDSTLSIWFARQYHHPFLTGRAGRE